MSLCNWTLHRARRVHGRLGRVETDPFARVHPPQTARRSTQEGRLCSSPKIQNQAAFGMSHSVNSVHSVSKSSIDGFGINAPPEERFQRPPW